MELSRKMVAPIVVGDSLSDGELAHFDSENALQQIINDELMLDGNPRLNLASFVNTWMEPEVEKLMLAVTNKNYVDMDEHPVTTDLQDKHERQEKSDEEKKEVEKPAAEAEKDAPAAEEKAEKVEEKKEEENLIVIELKVDMHCEGCARKVKKALSTIPGVGGLQVNIQSHKVLVKAKPAVDVLHVKERVQKKSGRKTELISPIPLPAKEEDAKPEENKEAAAKPEEKPQPEPEFLAY